MSAPKRDVDRSSVAVRVVNVDLAESGEVCIDVLCRYPARLIVQPAGTPPRPYCVEHCEDRLTYFRGRAGIVYSDGARALVTAVAR